jgi:integrase
MTNVLAAWTLLLSLLLKHNRRPATYSREELDRLFEKCNAYEKMIFATLLSTGLREEELNFFTWADADIKNTKNASIRVMNHCDAALWNWHSSNRSIAAQGKRY